MSDLKTFWFNSNTPAGYHNHLKKFASGAEDEITVVKIINKYLPSRNKIIVDLGIGTGRELDWIDKLNKIKSIFGVDYSPVMLDFVLQNFKDLKHHLELILDDLFKPKKLEKRINQEKTPIIYISLINTFGNFTSKERILVLKNICKLMKSSDRIILAIYKRGQSTKLNNFIKQSERLQTIDPNDQLILTELIEYGLLQFFWTSVMDKYNQLPRFWYDKENNDVVVHVNGKRLLASHRFSKEEIEKEFATANLKVDKIIEGKSMWIAVGKV
jgi:hypothetical protein